MKNTEDLKPYEVILSIVCFLLILYILTGNVYITYIALGLGILTLLSGRVAVHVVRLWSKLLMFVGKVNSFILLGGVFFIVLTPLAFMYRLWNRDSLRLKPEEDSYFVDRDHTFSSKDLENMW